VLTKNGIAVVETHLPNLQDSNPLYSGLWRWLIRPFGQSDSNTLSNPLGEGKVSLRSYLALLNFKANHRKLVITDTPAGELRAMVMSANPHDGSSAHRNVALQFGGDAVLDLLQAEYALLELNDARDVIAGLPEVFTTNLARGNMVKLEDRQTWAFPELKPEATDFATLRIVNESSIEAAAHDALHLAEVGQSVDLVMFYLSDRHIIKALLAAHARGVNLRVLLDVNKDAFGRSKNGVPNQPVARELNDAGIDVRWCVTLGEQCHAKMLLLRGATRDALLLGSGNYTRRNLDDFNLESDVLYVSPSGSDVIDNAQRYFDVQWNNADGRQYSADYDAFAKDQWWLAPQYRIMEFTGLGTF
jgi:phosphatidylserine/phosphatidylglycerophosphate/cardiolipin synthase-like enzyme